MQVVVVAPHSVKFVGYHYVNAALRYPLAHLLISRPIGVLPRFSRIGIYLLQVYLGIVFCIFADYRLLGLRACKETRGQNLTN